MNFYGLYGKRLTDITIAAAALCALWPVLATVAVLVKFNSPGPVFFRQPRVGYHMNCFSIIKFRTMVHAPYLPESLTVADDPRITTLGRFLRRLKLDELPQLWNVLRGEMSLVGPRPEIEYYVLHGYSEDERRAIFEVRPGLTDPVAIELINEEEILAHQSTPVEYYRLVLLPAKIKIYLEYVQEMSLKRDSQLMLATLLGIGRYPFGRHG